MAKDLWKYVDGSEVLAADATELVRTDYRVKAVSTLVMAITTPQLYLVTSCEGPKEMWDALRGRETLANKLFLKKQYFRKEIKESTSMEMHLKESIGAPISEEVTLLGSLPPSYSTVVTAIEARGDDLKLNYVQQAVTHEKKGAASDGASTDAGSLQ